MKVVTDPTLEEKVYIFENRFDAGKKLARFLIDNMENDEETVVLAIPRGGVPVGVIVARKLGAAFGLIIVRKIPIPWDPEAGFGAVTSYGEPVIDKLYARSIGMSEDMVEKLVEKVKSEIKRREEIYGAYLKPVDIKGKKIIVIDDGLATGYTMLAAIKSVKSEASKVIVAIPTASKSAIKLVSQEADQVFCLNVRSGIPYFAVADAYIEWRDLTDEDVISILKGFSD